MRRSLFFVAVLAGLVLATAATSAVAAPATTVVMSGLDNPRGLTFGQQEALFVAEAGRGGPQECGEGPEGPVQFGRTGAVSRLLRGTQKRIATGLPSLADAAGIGATGPHDIDFHGRNGLLTIGLGADPAARAQCPGSEGLGWLAKIDHDGDWRLRDDVAAYEASANPDRGAVDSNPYGLFKADAGAVVTDAGGNSLLLLTPRGDVTTLGVFPSRSTGRDTDAVPNSVTQGPDGAFYVGELTGFPFAVGAATVYRVALPLGAQPYLTGFTAIIDLAFAKDGSLYVLQFATGEGLSGPGALIRVAPNGTRTTVLSDGLIAPTSVAIGKDGDAYISNCGVFPGSGPYPCTGHVLKVDL
jgi:hypothetical protein